MLPVFPSLTALRRSDIYLVVSLRGETGQLWFSPLQVDWTPAYNIILFSVSLTPEVYKRQSHDRRELQVTSKARLSLYK